MNAKKLSRLVPYLYIVAVIFLVSFMIMYPAGRVFFYSFTKWNGISWSFVGFKNYVKLFQSPIFWKILSNNFIMLISIPVELGIAVIVALLLYQRIRGWRVYQMLVFIPVIIPVIVWGYVWTFLYSLDGPVNQILRTIGLGKFSKLWLADADYTLLAVMITYIWKDIGFPIILFLGRLLSLDPSLFDAAKTDGASSPQTLWYIAIPLLTEVIWVYAILSVMWIFTATFGYIYAMTGGGPGYSTTVLGYYIYTIGFQEFRMGRASAVSVILFLIVLLFVTVQLKISKRKG